MNVIYPRCCGLDVHHKTVAACVQVCREDGQKQTAVRTFGTWTQDLQRLADWLGEQGVTHVAMEATGVYGKPVGAVLERFSDGYSVSGKSRDRRLGLSSQGQARMPAPPGAYTVTQKML